MTLAELYNLTMESLHRLIELGRGGGRGVGCVCVCACVCVCVGWLTSLPMYIPILSSLKCGVGHSWSTEYPVSVRTCTCVYVHRAERERTKSAGERLLIEQNGHHSILHGGLGEGRGGVTHATNGSITDLCPETESCVANGEGVPREGVWCVVKGCTRVCVCVCVCVHGVLGGDRCVCAVAG